MRLLSSPLRRPDHPPRPGLRRGSPVVLLLLLQFFAASDFQDAHGQSPPLRFEGITLPGAQGTVLTVSGPSNRFDALEISTDLENWSPLATIQNANGAARFVHAAAANHPTLFYRAREVDHETVLVRINSCAGPAGTTVEILGRFFETGLLANAVRFGADEATVLEATESRLLVRVPTNAITSAVTVTTSLGESRGKQLFAVTETALVGIEPPPGMTAADFEVANSHGPALPAGPLTAGSTVVVTREMPQITFASPKDDGRHTFFYALSFSGAEPLTLNAGSTAEALVFSHPLLMSSDPFLARRVLEIIRGDTKVKAFAQLISRLYAGPGDASTNSLFLEAYSDAVISVGGSADVATLASRRAGHAHLALAAPGVPTGGVFPLEWYGRRFVEIVGSPGKFDVKGVLFNPVDWVVTIEELDVDKAFPAGRQDFDHLFRQTSSAPVLYPLRDAFLERRSVSADLLFSRFNLVSYFFKYLAKELTGAIVDQSVTLTKPDAIFLVRAVGPSFVTDVDFSFATTHLPKEYAGAVAINLVSAMVDLASAAIDSEALDDFLGDSKKMVKLVDEIVKVVPTIKAPEDLVGAALKLAAYFLKEEVNAPIKSHAKAYARGSTKVLDSAAGVIAAPLKVLKIVGGIGSVAERASGLFRTTTIEDTLILVGDPFKLQILSVAPPGASLGDDLTLVIRGARFNRASVKDQVNFEGSSPGAFFDGQVTAVADLSEDRQQLTVKLPRDAKAEDGLYKLSVNAQGRRGQTNFVLSSTPVVTGFAPAEGFAAVPDFLGQPFPGASVNLKGYSFSPADAFLFGGGIEATNKSGSTGDVTLRVPIGAISGVITVRRRFSPTDIREGRSQPFAVIGAPVILGMSPAAGPLSTLVILDVRNLGNDPALARIAFTGAQPIPVNAFGGTRVAVVAPVGVKDGPVSLLTPAGTATTAGPFTVVPGLARGATITVGNGPLDPTNPGVTWDRAMEFVMGTSFPVDDRDGVHADPVTGKLTADDPPREEGDFVTDNGPAFNPRYPVGPAYANTISIPGRIVGNFTLTGDLNTVSTGSDPAISFIEGTLTIVGNNNVVNVTLRNSPGHGLVIRGHNNTVTARCEDNAGDGVRIEGGIGNVLDVKATRNGGSGVTLTEGAFKNSLGISTGTKDPATRKFVPKSGNRHHGVLMLGDARENSVYDSVNGIITDSRFATANDGDGVHLEGNAVLRNTVSLHAFGNGGNGVTVAGGAGGNFFGGYYSTNTGHGLLIAGLGTDGNIVGQFPGRNVRLDTIANGKSGVVLAADSTGSPRNTTMGVTFCQTNGDYGVLLSGVIDTNGATQLQYFSGYNNQKAGIRLERGASGIVCSAPGGLSNPLRITGGPVGVEIDGPDTAANRVTAVIDQFSGNGVAITGARNNELTFTISKCGGTGMVLSGANSNQLVSVSVTESQGDGLRLTDGSQGNIVRRATVGGSRNGLVIDGGARNNLLRSLGSSGNRGHGALLQGVGTRGNRILGGNIGQGFAGGTNGGDGIRIQGSASDNQIGSDAYLPIQESVGAGIRISDEGTRGNVIKGCTIGFQSLRTQPAGILVENAAEDTTIGGPDQADRNAIQENETGIVVRSGARNVVIQNNDIQSAGKPAARIGILVDDASVVLIGGYDARSPNKIYRLPTAVRIEGPGTTNCRVVANEISDNGYGISVGNGAHDIVIGNGNVLERNQAPITFDAAFQNRVFDNRILDNSGTGVLFVNGARDNVVRGNSILRNFAGIQVIGPATVRNAFTRNSISGNGGRGIVLLDGGNQGIRRPTLRLLEPNSVKGTAGVPDGGTVEVFEDPIDEGNKFIAAAPVFDARFRAAVRLVLTEVDSIFRLNGTVTDPDGNTSEFGPFSPKAILPCSEFSISPGSLAIPATGGTMGTTIQIIGNSEPIELSVKGLPAGATATFNPNPVPVSGLSATNSAIFSLTVSGTLVPGAYPFTIEGKGKLSGCTERKTANFMKP